MDYENFAELLILALPSDNSDAPCFNNSLVECFRRTSKKATHKPRTFAYTLQEASSASFGPFPYALLSAASTTIGLFALYAVHQAEREILFSDKPEERKTSEAASFMMKKISVSNPFNAFNARNSRKGQQEVEEPPQLLTRMDRARYQGEKILREFSWRLAMKWPCKPNEIPEPIFSLITDKSPKKITHGYVDRSLARDPCSIYRAHLGRVLQLFDSYEFWKLESLLEPPSASFSERCYSDMNGIQREMYMQEQWKREEITKLNRLVVNQILESKEFFLGETTEEPTSVYKIGEEAYFSVTLDKTKLDFTPIVCALLATRLSIWQNEKSTLLFEVVEDVVREVMNIMGPYKERVSGTIEMMQGKYVFDTKMNHEDGRFIRNSTDSEWIKSREQWKASLQECKEENVGKSILKESKLGKTRKSKELRWKGNFERYLEKDGTVPERVTRKPRVRRSRQSVVPLEPEKQSFSGTLFVGAYG